MRMRIIYISSLNLQPKQQATGRNSTEQLPWVLGPDPPAHVVCNRKYPVQAKSSAFIVCPPTHRVTNDRPLSFPYWPLLSNCAVAVIQASGGVARERHPCFPNRQLTNLTYQEYFLPGSGWSHLLLGTGTI